jgi:hypothetical protein
MAGMGAGAMPLFEIALVVFPRALLFVGNIFMKSDNEQIHANIMSRNASPAAY